MRVLSANRPAVLALREAQASRAARGLGAPFAATRKLLLGKEIKETE